MARFFPCAKNCPGRKPGCHDHCERYQAKRAEWDKLNAQKRIDQGIKNYLCQNTFKSMDVAAKRKKSRIGIRRPAG